MYKNQNKKSYFFKTVLSGAAILISSVLFIGVVLVISPIITFIAGYFGGFIIKITFGTQFAEGLNYLFRTTEFSKEQLPLIFGVLGSIASIFKSTNTSKSKSKN